MRTGKSLVPEDVKVLRYIRMLSESGGDMVHLILINKGGKEMLLKLASGGSMYLDVEAVGGRARPMFDLLFEDHNKDIDLHPHTPNIESKNFDSEGEKALATFFHPFFGFDWSKYETEAETGETEEAIALANFHSVLKSIVKDWKGSRAPIYKLVRHRYWPTFHAMVVAAVKAKYGSKVKLYRGVYGRYAYDILKGAPLDINEFNSWSVDQREAQSHVSARKDYWLVVRAIYPAEQAVFAPVTLPDYEPDPDVLGKFNWEKEIVIRDKRGSLPASAYRVVAKTRKKLVAAERVVYRFLNAHGL